MQTTQQINTLEVDIQKAIAASDLYQILSISLWLPTEQLTAGLLDGSLAEDVCSIMGELKFSEEEIEKFKDKLNLQGKSISEEELLIDLRQEYTRLFNHPNEPQVDIYETLFLHDPEEGEKAKPALFISPAALDVERIYRKAGLLRSGEVNEPSDHMATEMEFMMYLYLQKARALQENNTEEVARREDEIQEFNEVHLKKWARDFFDLCTSSSNHTVYRTFGEMGKLFMQRVLPSS
ncbi:MAG: molecular chaperone TorD family protein [Syntrophomonadaceae bacterium]|nr:molecular chaperone TorD family protein [Syntrophomonadaceae bacterium]